MRSRRIDSRWALPALTLLAGQLSWAGIIVNSQTTACLDDSNHCSAAGAGTLTNGAEFNTFSQVATATAGIMHIGATSSFNVNNSKSWSLGFVSFQDILTINSASKNGQTGHLILGYHIDGTISQAGQADAFLQVVARIPGPPLQNSVADYNSSINSSFVVPLVFNFVYGQQFTLYMSMQAMVGTAIDQNGFGYSLVNRTGTGSGAVNFINTLVVDQLTTNDLNNANVADSVFTADSGATYTQNGVVPEPGSMAMVGLAIPALLWLRRRSA